MSVFMWKVNLKPYCFFEVLNVVNDVDVNSYGVYEEMMTCWLYVCEYW